MSPLDLIPASWRVDVAAAALVVGLVGFGGAGLALHHRWYGEGFVAASAHYQKLMAEQAAANRAAVDGANKALLATADDLSRKNKELDNVLQQIDASAGTIGGDAPGLDARRVRDLGAIR